MKSHCLWESTASQEHPRPDSSTPTGCTPHCLPHPDSTWKPAIRTPRHVRAHTHTLPGHRAFGMCSPTGDTGDKDWWPTTVGACCYLSRDNRAMPTAKRLLMEGMPSRSAPDSSEEPPCGKASRKVCSSGTSSSQEPAHLFQHVAPRNAPGHSGDRHGSPEPSRCARGTKGIGSSSASWETLQKGHCCDAKRKHPASGTELAPYHLFAVHLAARS